MKPFLFYYRDGLGWVRIFGAGVHWKDLRRRELSFMERYGFKRGFAIGPWFFRFLRNYFDY